MKTLLKIIGGIFLILIVLGIIGAVAGSKSTSSPQTQTEEAQTVAESKPAPTPLVVQVREFADEFDANQVAAEEKWNGKLVQLLATVSNITDSGLSFTNVASKQFSFTSISCHVVDKGQVLSIKNGEMVTVKGTVSGQTFGTIDLNDCSVVK